MQKLAYWCLLATLALAVQAQEIRRATVSGARSTSGKCTLEVTVDGVAEVDIYGDSGRLRTIAGQTATWKRFECSDALPYTMSDFRFRGVDGRGSVRLLQDPRNNNSMAVVRIEDPRAGAEGYTFDIEWSGGSANAPTGGFQQNNDWFSQTTPSPTTPSGRAVPGDWRGRGMSMPAEAAIDLCRNELRTRAERDYSLRSIDITSAAVDTGQGRRNRVTGEFRGAAGGFRRDNAYRYSCEIDPGSSQVRTLEIRQSDGTVLQPGTYTSAGQGAGSVDQIRNFRACQDAVVARTNRDGYQNVIFNTTVLDPQRSGYVSGNITAHRGPVTDTFDYACQMDLRNATVRNLDWTRR